MDKPEACPYRNRRHGADRTRRRRCRVVGRIRPTILRRSMAQRPRTVPVVAAFLFAATAIAAVAGVSLIWPNALLDRLCALNKPGAAAFRGLGGRISGTALLLLGAGTLAA